MDGLGDAASKFNDDLPLHQVAVGFGDARDRPSGRVDVRRATSGTPINTKGAAPLSAPPFRQRKACVCAKQKLRIRRSNAYLNLSRQCRFIHTAVAELQKCRSNRLLLLRCTGTWNALARSHVHGSPSISSLPLTLRSSRGQSLKALRKGAGTASRYRRRPPKPKVFGDFARM